MQANIWNVGRSGAQSRIVQMVYVSSSHNYSSDQRYIFIVTAPQDTHHRHVDRVGVESSMSTSIVGIVYQRWAVSLLQEGYRWKLGSQNKWPTLLTGNDWENGYLIIHHLVSSDDIVATTCHHPPRRLLRQGKLFIGLKSITQCTIDQLVSAATSNIHHSLSVNLMDDFDVKVGRRYANRVVELDILPHLEESIVNSSRERDSVRRWTKCRCPTREIPLSSSDMNVTNSPFIRYGELQ